MTSSPRVLYLMHQIRSFSSKDDYFTLTHWVLRSSGPRVLRYLDSQVFKNLKHPFFTVEKSRKIDGRNIWIQERKLVVSEVIKCQRIRFDALFQNYFNLHLCFLELGLFKLNLQVVLVNVMEPHNLQVYEVVQSSKVNRFMLNPQ